MFDVKKLFQKSELIPVIVPDIHTRQVLMLGFANEEAVRKTFETKTAWFWSRSRKQLWNKGETSGNFMYVKEIYTDCDTDTLLLLAEPAGPACHTGAVSCFYNQLEQVANGAAVGHGRNHAAAVVDGNGLAAGDGDDLVGTAAGYGDLVIIRKGNTGLRQNFFRLGSMACNLSFGAAVGNGVSASG